MGYDSCEVISAPCCLRLLISSSEQWSVYSLRVCSEFMAGGALAYIDPVHR